MCTLSVNGATLYFDEIYICSRKDCNGIISFLCARAI